MSSSPRHAALPWIAVLLAALVLLAFDTARRIQHIHAVSATSGALVQPPALDASSPTGYAGGLRRVILPSYGIDGYHWIMQTQQMFATGELRIRHVDYDNAPAGRDVHWASPFRWWIGFLSWLDQRITGDPIGVCVERAAVYANPILLGLLLLVSAPAVARRFGTVPAIWLTGGLISAIPFTDYFNAGNPDHHGIAALCALLTVLGVVAGGAGITSASASRFTIAPSVATARRWFILSAIFAGLGLWISSASEAPVLAAIGLGSLWAGATHPLRAGETRAHAADLWRLWGRWGAGTSLLTYLIEYFPSHLGWRLEVNHPLYALAWWGGAELLRLWWLSEKPSAFLNQLRRPWFWVSATAVLALPVTILLGGSEVFRIRDPFLWALHHEYISEFQPFWIFFSSAERGPFFWSSVLPWLLVVPIAFSLWKSKRTGAARAVTILALIPTAVYFAMSAEQIRWTGFAMVLLCLLVASDRWIRGEEHHAGTSLGRSFYVVCGVLAITPAFYRSWHLQTRPEGISQIEVTDLASREVAYWLARRSPAKPPVVAASPGLSTKFAYYGGAKTLGTLYWENTPGLERSAAFFGARSEEQAHQIAQATGLTHLVFLSWSDFAEPYVKLIRGIKKTDPAPDDAFVLNLLTQIGPPLWLRPVACMLPANPALEDTTAFIFEVVPPQSPEAALVNMVNFLIDSERVAVATKLLSSLAQYPTYLPARICRARLLLALGRNAEFVAAMKQMAAEKPAGDDLTLEMHIHRALLNAVVGADKESAQEFRLCWRLASEKPERLRQLSDSALLYLLQQSQRLDIAPPADLRSLARNLLPPQWAAHL